MYLLSINLHFGGQYMFDAELRRISVCLFKVLQLCWSFLFITLSAQLINSDMLRCDIEDNTSFDAK